MSNMSYCRFENTYNDLRDCLDALDNSSVEELEEHASEYGRHYIRKLIKLCIRISDNYKDELNESED